MRRLLAFGLALWPVLASAAPVDDLTDALRLPELAVMMRDEGLVDSEDLLPEGPSGNVPATAMAQIADIFDPDRIAADMRKALADGLSDAQLKEATAFFDSPPGRALVMLELIARSAISDADIEAGARARWAARANEDSKEIRLIKRFAEVNALVERNTASTMTARYQFLRGLGDGSGNPVDEDQILAQVWGGAEMIRAETEDWVMGYLLLAYGPADPADLRAYVDFSATDAGQAVNAALFDGFGVAYGRISYGLGLVSGRAALAQDL